MEGFGGQWIICPDVDSSPGERWFVEGDLHRLKQILQKCFDGKTGELSQHRMSSITVGWEEQMGLFI